jgi:hypothetical protein
LRPAGDDLTLTGLVVDSDPTVSAGTSTLTSEASNIAATSRDGVGYRIFFYGSQKADVAKAALTITADDVTKVQGNPAVLTFSTSDLFNGDSVSAVTLASAGAAAIAGAGTYAITASNASGTGLSNYVIAYVGGTLTVTAVTPKSHTGPLSPTGFSPADSPIAPVTTLDQDDTNSVLDGLTCVEEVGPDCGASN